MKYKDFYPGLELQKVYSDPRVRAFKESNDHEVSMADGQLDTIIKMATELKEKISNSGKTEFDIPAWIQDHISKSESYIYQANNNYHDYGGK